MDFNLNDFSGIGLEESQFMDQSNANINNVFNVNPEFDGGHAANNNNQDRGLLQHEPLHPQPSSAHPGEAQHAGENLQIADRKPQEPKMIGLQDLNLPFGAGLLGPGVQGGAAPLSFNQQHMEVALADMSRISMTVPVEGQEPKEQAVDVGAGKWNPAGVQAAQPFPVIAEEPQSSATQVESSQAASTAGAGSSSAAPTSATEWKKPKIQKKKRLGGKNQKAPQETAANQAAPAGSGQAQPGPMKKKPEALQTRHLEAARKENIVDQYELNRQRYRQAQNKRAAEVQSPSSPVPIPLFDCIYCVGIHEHLVLQTRKERTLTSKYGCARREPGEQDKLAHNGMDDYEVDSEGADFYEQMETLDQLFVVNLMATEAERKNLARLHGEASESADADESLEKEADAGQGSSTTNTSKQADQADNASSCLSGKMAMQELRALAIQQEKDSYNPLGAEVDLQKRVIARMQRRLLQNQAKKKDQSKLGEQAQRHAAGRRPSEDEEDGEENLNMISNLLDNFEEIDPEEQSMFLNLNIRNRRQKLLHNMSFETECFDIYDPHFTSDEENDSSSGSGSSGSSNSSSVYGSQDESSNSQQSSQEEDDDAANGNRRRQPPRPLNGLPQIDGQVQKQLQIHGLHRRDERPGRELEAQEEEPEAGSITHYAQNKMNDMDLLAMDYDSENNHSSLSSIHREIAPVAEMGIGIGEMCHFANAQPKPTRYQQQQEGGGHLGAGMPAFNPTIVQTFSASGGCQVEEMRDDTVVNRCNNMFQSQLAKSEVRKKRTQAPMQSKEALLPRDGQGRSTDQNMRASDGQKYIANLANEDESIIRILPGLPSGMVTSAADVKHEVDSQSPSHIGLSPENSREEAAHPDKLQETHIVGLTTLDKAQLSPVRNQQSFYQKKAEQADDLVDPNRGGTATIQIQQISQNAKGQHMHELRLREDENGDGSNLDRGNEIQIQDLGNNIVHQQNILTDESSSAYLSDLQMDQQKAPEAYPRASGKEHLARPRTKHAEDIEDGRNEDELPNQPQTTQNVQNEQMNRRVAQFQRSKKIVSANMSIISSIYNQSRELTVISQGQLSQSSHQTLSPIKYRPSGANPQELRTISACQSQDKYVKSSTQKEAKKKVGGQRQVSSELEIDFYNQWGKSAKELRLREAVSRGSRANSQSNSECTFKGKAQTSQPQRCGATSFGMAPAALSVPKGARGTSMSRKSRSRLSKHEDQPDAVAAVILAGATAAGISASTGNLPALRGPLRKRNAAGQRDSIQSHLSQGHKQNQQMKSVKAIEATGNHANASRQAFYDKEKQQARREKPEGQQMERQHQPSRSELNLVPKHSSKSRQKAGNKLLGKQGSQDSGVDEAPHTSATPKKGAADKVMAGLHAEVGVDSGTTQSKSKNAKPLKSLILPPENLGVEVAQLKKQAETSTKSEMLRRKKHQQLVNRASIDSCKQQSRKVNNFMIGPLDRNVGQKLLGRYQLTTHPASSTNSNTTKNVLSKEQIQLMRHFEKQQQIQQMQQNQQQQAIAHDLEKKAAMADGKISESKSKKKLLLTDQQSNNFNRKNVIENYFQIGGGTAGGRTLHPQEGNRLRAGITSDNQAAKPSQKQRPSHNQPSKKSRDRSREKSIETRAVAHGLMAAATSHAGSYQMTVQAAAAVGRQSNANVYTLGGGQAKAQGKKATSSSIDKNLAHKNYRHGSIGSQLGQIIDKADSGVAAEDDPGEMGHAGTLKSQVRQAQAQNCINDEPNAARGSNGKQSKSQLNNQRQMLNLNLNQMSEPSRKSNLALQRGKVQSNQVLKFENPQLVADKAQAAASGTQGAAPASVSSQITPKSQTAVPRMKFEALKNSALGYGGTLQQKKGPALKNMEKLARYQSMPEDAINDASSARTTNKKGTQKVSKLRNPADMPLREKNKSAEKLKKSAGADNNINASRGRGSGARPQNQQMTQKSVLHSSTSHLEQFSMSHEALSMIVNNQKKPSENADENMMLMIDDGGDQICTLGSGPPARIHWNEDAAITNVPHRTKAKKSNMKVVTTDKQAAAVGLKQEAAAADDASLSHLHNITDSNSSLQQPSTAQKTPAQPIFKQFPGGFHSGQPQPQHLKSQKLLQGGMPGMKKDHLSKAKASQAVKNSSISTDVQGQQEEKRADVDQRSDQQQAKSRPAARKHHANTAATKKASAKITRTRSKDRDQHAVTVKKNEPRASLQKQALTQVAALPPAAVQGDTEAMKRQILENAKLLQFNSNLLATTVQSPKDPAEAQQRLQAFGNHMKDLKQASNQQNIAQHQVVVLQGAKGDPRQRQVNDLAPPSRAAHGEAAKMYKNQILNFAAIGGSTMPAKALAAPALAGKAPPLMKAKSHQATESKQPQLEDGPMAAHPATRVQGQNLAKKKFQTLLNDKMKIHPGVAPPEHHPQPGQNQVRLSNFSSLPLQIQQKQALNLRSMAKAAKGARKNVDYFKTNEKEGKSRAGNGSGLMQMKAMPEKLGQKVMVPLNTEKNPSPSRPVAEMPQNMLDVCQDQHDTEGLQHPDSGWQWSKNAPAQTLASALSQKGQDVEQIETMEAELLESMTMQQPPSAAKHGGMGSYNSKGLSAAAHANNTNIGGVSLIGTQHPGGASLGLTTTFLQSGGNLCNANTTASSNTLLINNKSLNNQHFNNHASHLQNQTNITSTAIKAANAAGAMSSEQKKSIMKIQNLLQKTQMVERRLQSTSKANFNVGEDCSVEEAALVDSGALDPADSALINSHLEDDVQPPHQHSDGKQLRGPQSSSKQQNNTTETDKQDQMARQQFNQTSSLLFKDPLQF